MQFMKSNGKCQVKIPKSKAGLKRPVDKRHAFLRIERVMVWGTYAGEPEKTGTIILDRKPDGRFKLVPLDTTPNSLLTQVAHFVGRHGSLTSEEGKHGLVFRGELRNPGEPTDATTQEPEPEVAPAREKALAETVKIPKSKAGLKRPVDKRHALLRIERENAWIRSLNRELAETFCALVTRGDPVTVAKTAGVMVWGTYAGEPENTGTIILDRKPDGRFKVTPQEPESEVAPAAEAPTGGFEKITGADAIAAIGQKVTMEIIDRGVKVRIRGKQADCEKTAKCILKGSPTAASQQGAKYMIEGNLSKSFLRKGANQQGPDANGVYTRVDVSEHTFTAFGENLTAVQAACLTGCKEDTMFTIVVNDRSAGHFVISSGRRRLV
jgi:hypothetical protein